MTDIGDEDQTETWRQYYDNPLTVATNAMLHINGAEEQNNTTTTHYEIYKDEPVGSPNVGGTLALKLANPASESVVEASHVESIFVQGGAEIVKREPEDLTRKCISPVERSVLSDKRRLVTHGDSPPALIPTQSLKDDLDSIKEEGVERPRNHTIVIQSNIDTVNKMSSAYQASFSASPPQPNYESVPYITAAVSPNTHYASSTSPVIARPSSVYTPADQQSYYREFYQVTAGDIQYRPEYATADVHFDRYPRPATYRTIVTVDSSPDSGISSDLSAKEQLVLPQQTFSYEDLSQQGTILTADLRPVTVSGASPGASRGSPVGTPSLTRSWPDFSRHSDHDKIQIPKIHSDDDKVYIEKIDNHFGYRYFFESPISTSPRREDDRITYINKGQFYAITMEYVHEPEKIRKSTVVRSVIMLMFREEKSTEDERKAWHFWHSRQHSVKQRILDVDTKNSAGIIGCVEEISHNAIAVFWNPSESPAKVNVAVQCLSTDFSSQKGVKGLPLHIQIDTYDDPREGSPIVHRGYCQIKVFCDKGAERKTRDEERRAQKRRMNPSTRKKYEDLYHAPCDRSQFYSMADLLKEPVLFKPNDDVDKVVSYMGGMDMPGSFYPHETDSGVCAQTIGTGSNGISLSPSTSNIRLFTSQSPSPVYTSASSISCSSPPPCSSQESASFTTLAPLQPSVSTKSNRLHQNYQSYGEYKEIGQSMNGGSISNVEDLFQHQHKRTRITPPLSERVMLFVRRDIEDVYTPLHLIPPGKLGLLNAIEQKFELPRNAVKNLYRKNKFGVRAIIDDDMLRHYCNEECFILDIEPISEEYVNLTLTEVSHGSDH